MYQFKRGRGRLSSSVALCTIAATMFAGAPAQAAVRGGLDQSWGTATVEANRTIRVIASWDVAMSVTLRDKVADNKCVYVEYKIITARGTDADSTLATACNRETVTRSTVRTVGGRMGMATPQAVEFKMCKAVWGVDPCQKTTVRF